MWSKLRLLLGSGCLKNISDTPFAISNSGWHNITALISRYARFIPAGRPIDKNSIGNSPGAEIIAGKARSSRAEANHRYICCRNES